MCLSKRHLVYWKPLFSPRKRPGQVAGVEEGLWWGLPLFPLGLHGRTGSHFPVGLPGKTGSLSLRKSETDIETDTSTVSVDAVAGLRTSHRGDGSLRIYPLRLVTLYLHEDRCCLGKREDVVPKWQCALYSPPSQALPPDISCNFFCMCALVCYAYMFISMFACL